MGIKRDSLSKSGHSTTIDDRITSARGCAYSLMGAGLHGGNGGGGGNPRVSLSLWSTYVLPRLTFFFYSSQVKSSKIYFKSVLYITFITQAPRSFFHRPTNMHKISQYI